jgi:hypothetical protein
MADSKSVTMRVSATPTDKAGLNGTRPVTIRASNPMTMLARFRLECEHSWHTCWADGGSE